MKWPKEAVQHVHCESGTISGDEHFVSGTSFHVDGFLSDPQHRRELLQTLQLSQAQASTVTPLVALEFFGDIFHGHPKFERTQKPYFGGKKTYGERYDATMKRMDTIVKRGYVVLYVWEHDFMAWERNPNGQSVWKLLKCHGGTSPENAMMDTS